MCRASVWLSFQDITSNLQIGIIPIILYYTPSFWKRDACKACICPMPNQRPTKISRLISNRDVSFLDFSMISDFFRIKECGMKINKRW